MAVERLIGSSGIAAMTSALPISGTARMLGWNWKTDQTNKRVVALYVKMHESGTFDAGTRCQLWKRNTPISTSLLKVDIDIGGLTGTPGADTEVPGVSGTPTADRDLVQNAFYFVTLYHPDTQTGNYNFKSGFGNPASGSMSGNCIFRNGGTPTQPPDDETFTNGGFGVDVAIDSIGGPAVGWVRKVGRHVTVLKRVSATFVKPRPGIITALGAGELVNVRTGHSGETFTNLDRRTDPDENLTTSKYISY